MRFAIVLLMLAGAARAEDLSSLTSEERERRSRALFEQGRAHVNLGDYPAAIADFEQAYLLKPLPLFLYDIAQLTQRLGQREKALRLYRQFVREDPDSPKRAEADRHIAELKEPSPSPIAVVAAPAPSARPLALTPAPSPAPARRPSRSWIWGVSVAAAMVVGGAVALGVVFGASNPTPELGRGTLR